jgi:hypothetical protein
MVVIEVTGDVRVVDGDVDVVVVVVSFSVHDTFVRES